MKIGILTHHYINNFGAFLQGYALQKAVSRLFPRDDVYIIDYLNYKHFIINTGGWFRFYRRKENVPIWLQKIQLLTTFSKARKQHMNLTSRCKTVKQLNQLGLDCVIVGSDEVWNYGDKKSYASVKFGIGIKVKKLIAYAPSVGKTVSDNIPDEIVQGIKSFSVVSARDEFTEITAKKIRNEEICQVVDPTFLTDIPDEVVQGINRPYILFYYCDGLDDKEKEKIIAYAKNNNMDVYGAGEADCRYTRPTVNLTPFQWVWMFRNASRVVTGTFHGTVFSMLNHRQFACYLTNPSRIKKVCSLLNEYSLSDRWCEGKAEAIIEKMNEPIDYSLVQEKIDQRKKESLDFLLKALSE